jgi:NAD(P)-dependent dehydrogenase (short-subunit alcohol dehydrogenase family)
MANPGGPYVVPPAGRVKDKVVLVTGGGSGLGREASLLLAREGAFVVVTDIDFERAKDVASEVEATTDQPALSIRADVTVESEVQRAVQVAVERFERLDVMVANAGVGIEGMGSVPFEETTAEAWEAVTNVNLRGVFFSIKHAARVMKNRGGSIVVTSSAAAFVAYPGMAIYAAGKGGVNALVRGAAFDLGKYGIRVNSVCPSHGMSVNFGLHPNVRVLGMSWEQATSPEWNPETAPMPLHIARPPMLIDNAYPILYLASDETAYLSGACIPAADGGTLARVAINFPEGWSLQERLDNAKVPLA